MITTGKAFSLRILLSPFWIPFLTTLFFLASYGTARGHEVTLAWDLNEDPTVRGYRVYYGVSSRHYDASSDVGMAATTVVSGLTEGQVFYFAVTAYNGDGLESDLSAEISTTVQGASAPVAVAGEDQKVVQGFPVSLDGSGSYDPDGAIAGFSWRQTEGPAVTLHDEETAAPRFEAPILGTTGATLTFELTVTDLSGLSATDTCRVSVPGAKVIMDAEDGSTSGWFVYDRAPRRVSMRNTYDAAWGSRVIELSGMGTKNAYRYSRDPSNMKALWDERTRFVIEWSHRYAETFGIYVEVTTTAGHRYLSYTPAEESTLGTGEYVHHGLGGAAMDGTWQTCIRDLQADLEAAQPGVTILSVDGFLVRGSGSVDSIILHGE